MPRIPRGLRYALCSVPLATIAFIAPNLPSTTEPSAAHAAGSRPRYLMAMATSIHPTDDEIRAAAGRLQAMVFNPSDAEAARTLKSLDPQVHVYTYMDLSSVRDYERDVALSGGVSFNEAERRGWIARNQSGQYFTWDPHPGHYQTAVWDQGYRDAWTATAVAKAANGPWDGIFADNDMISLRYYNDRSHQLLAGTTTQDQTDELVVSGIDQLVKQAGPALNARGKSLMVNVGDGRLRMETWASHTQYGGGAVEMFLSWSRDGTPDIWDWGDTGWSTVREQVLWGPKTLAITPSASWDMRTKLYGYGTFLLRANVGDAWTADDWNRVANLPPETGIDLGLPTTWAGEEGGAWTRRFERGWVAVNPSGTATRTIATPPGVRGLDGRALGWVTLQPLSAAVLPAGW